MESADALLKSYARLNDRVRAFDKYGEVERTEQYAEAARALDDELAQARDTAEAINAEETLFSLPVTKFAQIAHMKDGLDPYLKLWGTAAGFKTSEQEWMNSPFMTLDPEKIDNEVRLRLIRIFGRTSCRKRLDKSPLTTLNRNRSTTRRVNAAW